MATAINPPRKRSALRRGLTGLLVVTLVVVLAIAATLVWLRFSTQPQVSGTLTLSGLSGPVDIVRDAEGVPHIRASHADDAMFALGFVHAQDRLWQLELNRRIAAGRVAEILGSSALENDRFLRTLGVRRNAEAQLAQADPATRHALQRYADGVNAAFATRQGVLPPEFLLTRAPAPEPWTPVDSLSWLTMMAWDLSGNWSTELQRMRLSARLNARQIGELLPPYPGDTALPVADFGALYRSLRVNTVQVAANLLKGPPGLVEGMGSNNWVAAGRRSASGKPLLANDPHLGLTTPSLWYLAHISAPGLEVQGATLPGLPFVVLGRNARIAWGFTNTAPDSQDLYIEEVRGHEVRTPDGWAPLEVRKEIIRVRDAPDHELLVRVGPHGPIISDTARTAKAAASMLLPERPVPLADTPSTTHALALSWSALRPDDKTAQAGMMLNRAGNWSEFLEAMRHFHSPQQSVVYADVDGNIGFIAAGRVPVRKPDNDLMGQAPAPGWLSRYDWTGWIPFEELPRKFNPPESVIATANEKIVPPNYPHFITSEWALPYRAERIAQQFRERDLHNLDSLAAIQADTVSLAALELLPWLLTTRPASEEARQALEKLRAWRGDMHPDRAEPAIFAAWMRELTRVVYLDDLGPDLFADYWDQRHTFMVMVLTDTSWRGALWCDDVVTSVQETCLDQQSRALELALADLKSRAGSNPSRWRWGELHQARAEHRPFSRVPVLRSLFDIVVPTGGDTYTINAGRYTLRNADEPFVNRHAASLRMLFDLADSIDSGKSRFIHSGGQSGNLLSSHYANFTQRWARGESIGIGAAAKPGTLPKGAKRLTLQPAAR